MKTQYIDKSLSREERETVITCVYDEDGNYIWEAESSIPTHMTKLKKAGWEQTGELIAKSSNSVQSMSFRAKVKKPLSFRDLTKPKRTMSEEQKIKMKEGIALSQKKREFEYNSIVNKAKNDVKA